MNGTHRARNFHSVHCETPPFARGFLLSSNVLHATCSPSFLSPIAACLFYSSDGLYSGNRQDLPHYHLPPDFGFTVAPWKTLNTTSTPAFQRLRLAILPVPLHWRRLPLLQDEFTFAFYFLPSRTLQQTLPGIGCLEHPATQTFHALDLHTFLV